MPNNCRRSWCYQSVFDMKLFVVWFFFFLGHHLAPGHPKDPEDHDPDPLKSQGKNPGLSPVLLTDLTRSQRKANTDNVNIFYDAVTLTGNAVLFLCLNSLLKNKKAFLTFFFVNARVYS